MYGLFQLMLSILCHSHCNQRHVYIIIPLPLSEKVIPTNLSWYNVVQQSILDSAQLKERYNIDINKSKLIIVRFIYFLIKYATVLNKHYIILSMIAKFNKQNDSISLKWWS